MKIGLLTDIHESVKLLRTALAYFESERVDRIVHVGDVFATGEHIEETCRLLSGANVAGVWGNHDFGLSCEPSEALRGRFPESVVEYMTTLHPRLVVGDCHFMHVEPWLNPMEVTDLWYYEGPPDSKAKVERIFGGVPQRILFGGHYHRWLLVTPDGMRDWNGERPIRLQPGRFFVVIGALSQGRFATFDTETSELIPFNVA